MKREVGIWLCVLAAAVAVATLVKAFAFTSCTIPFSGMENTLFRGDRVLVNKWAYGLRLPLAAWWGCRRLAQKPVSSGDIVVFNNPLPARADEAVDRRAVFIGRCVGLPGDTLMLTSRLEVTSQAVLSPDYKSLYAYPKEAEDTVLQALRRLAIEGNELIGFQEEQYVRSLSHYEVYLLRQELGASVPFTSLRVGGSEEVHPFVMPRRGESVRVYPWNVRLLCRAVGLHEGRRAEVRGDTLLVDGRKVFSYRFSQDYYWMVSNDVANQHDSRRFGLVPASHLIGRAAFVWFSKDPEKGWLDGYRWHRFFQQVK